jgi:anhydro-N-acetylmuramic acid kinase
MQSASTDVVGLMSGTSLDGLDLVCVRFSRNDLGFDFQLLASETRPYTVEMQEKLAGAHRQSGFWLAQLDVDLGRYFGQEVTQFVKKFALQPAYIGSHGHTIFHQPALGFTLQIGQAHHLAVQSGLPVVTQFRNLDVALGGQGAPLVPIADQWLYSTHDGCLNLGGIANISYQKEGIRLAQDLCVCNMAMNMLAKKAGLIYDNEGSLARAGVLLPALLEQLNQDPFLQEDGPKSMGIEYFEKWIEPLILEALQHHSISDVLHTMVIYIARIISDCVKKSELRSILVTGGGAYNTFLIERLNGLGPALFVVGEAKEVEFKEAIAFAFLAYLRMNEEINVLRSVTGAHRDHMAGVVYYPAKDA